MAAARFRPTELDLALAADPVAEAARIAMLIAASEHPVSIEQADNSIEAQHHKQAEVPPSEQN